MRIINAGFVLFFAFGGLSLKAQEELPVIDKIIVVLGNEIILNSDVQLQKEQIRAQGYSGEVSDCAVLEEILYEKLLLNQAKLDSVEVTDDMVQTELDKRIRIFVQQIGSIEALEEYYGKSIAEIREEFGDVLRDQLLVQRMEGEITADVNVTPKDVRLYFESIPKDSLPYMNATVEMAQIVIYASSNIGEENRVKEKLRQYKEEVETGKNDFETLAVLYSEDPGSAVKGGELGLQSRGTFVPEFDAVAFGLKEGQVSSPFKSDYGYHIMQMVELRGEQYNARHILLKPKITAEELDNSLAELDSIRGLVKMDSLTFEQAANRFSDDERSKNQNGYIVNENTGSTVYEMDQIDPQLFQTIDTLEVDEYSKPAFYQSPDGKKGFRIIKLNNRTEPHRANLREDYQAMQNAASQSLRKQIVDKWMREKIAHTYLKMDEDYKDCAFNYLWIKDQGETKSIK